MFVPADSSYGSVSGTGFQNACEVRVSLANELISLLIHTFSFIYFLVPDLLALYIYIY